MAIFHMHCRMHMCAFNVVVIHFSWPVCFPFQSVVSGESQKKKIAKQKKRGGGDSITYIHGFKFKFFGPGLELELEVPVHWHVLRD